MDTENRISQPSKNSSKTGTIISIPESLDHQWVSESSLISRDKKSTLILDFSKNKRIDSAGVCFIRLLHSMFKEAGGKLVLRNISNEQLVILQSFPSQEKQSSVQASNSGLIEKIGSSFKNFSNSIIFALSVLAEMLYWGTFGLLKKRDFRKGSLGEQMYQLGYKAVVIVGMLSFLIGLVLAMQSAMQLKTYGAGVFLGPLIGLTMVREMGPLLTAIILAGRTGSATTAEIATMGVGEELDALQTMGINPIQFVIVPKFWAITLTMPLLSILATVAGILGGFVVAISYLDLSSSLYWNELGNFLAIRDVLAGFIKSIIFSWLIIWIGSFYGLRVKGGAEAVGKETTASVVTGIFIIILTDGLFSFIL